MSAPPLLVRLMPLFAAVAVATAIATHEAGERLEPSPCVVSYEVDGRMLCELTPEAAAREVGG